MRIYKPANLMYKKLSKILEPHLEACYLVHKEKIPIKYHGYIVCAMLDLLDEYNNFLLDNNYTDADVYAEEPTAIDRFLTEE